MVSPDTDVPEKPTRRTDAEPDAADAVSRGPLVSVDDPADERLADYRRLNDPAIRRRVEADQGIFVVEGRVAVGQLLGSDYRVRSLFVDDHQVTAAADLVEGVRARGMPVYVGAHQLVAATVGFALHRGVVALAFRPDPADAKRVLTDALHTPSVGGGPPLVAVLEGLNDHENIGAVFRNAAAFGVAGVLLDPTCADPLYRRSVRVSVGHVLHVPFARLAPWPAALGQVRAAGFRTVAMAPHPPAPSSGGSAVPLTQLVARLAELGPRPGSGSRGAAALPVGMALLLGAEGPGLSEAALEAADLVVSIPMADGVDSLNVATAAAIAFHRLSSP
jgi:tRNA G18 (ribose-2'-O)-methylase SpoU